MSDCNGCSLEHMATRIAALEAENLHLRMYAPARRAEKNAEPVKQINPTDWAAWGPEAKDITDRIAKRLLRRP